MFSLLIALVLPATAKRQARVGLDDFDDFQKVASKDVQICGRATFSKEFDGWLKSFMIGDLALAEKEWGLVLDSVAKCKSVEMLHRRAVARMAFYEPVNGAKARSFTLLTLFKHWLKVVKSRLGERHRFVGDCYGSIANYYEGNRQFKLAAMYRRKQFNVYSTCFGNKDVSTLRALIFRVKNMLSGGDYQAMEPAVKKAISLSEKANMPAATRESVRLYVAMLKATNREKQARDLSRRYRSIL